jgi:CMP-N,N'-diacetyllegionaminic acid synthase
MTQVLAIIPARGGSKGLPRKNVTDLRGRPLIAWSIQAAKSCELIDRVVVSTEDSAIAAVAQKYGADVPFMRPPELAADDTPILDVVRHAIKELSFQGSVVLLQPTSPLRTSLDINNALQIHFTRNDNVVSVTKTKFHPSWILNIVHDRIVSNNIADRRQIGGDRFVPNGAIYISRTEHIEVSRPFFEDAVPYVMPMNRSIDIDTLFDLFIAKCVLEANLGND